MSSATEKTLTSDDKENDIELNITKKNIYLPLAIAGGLGGVCNGGIVYVISNQYKFFIQIRSSNNEPVTTPNLPLIYNFSLYLLFSIFISIIVAPAFAIFTLGFSNTKNITRILVLTVLLGAFLPSTIKSIRQVLDAPEEINNIKEQEEEKKVKVLNESEEIAINTTEKIIENVNKNINQKPNNVNLQKLEIIKIEFKSKADIIYEFGILSNKTKEINSKVNELKELKKQVNSKKEIKDNDKDELKKHIDNYINQLEELIQKLIKVQESIEG